MFDILYVKTSGVGVNTYSPYVTLRYVIVMLTHRYVNTEC